MIPVFSNTLGQEELVAVGRVMASRWLGVGQECAAFERELAAYWKTDTVLLHNSCTSATYNAVKALGVREFNEIIITTVGFVATLSAVLDLGAEPVFADVDPRTLNILPSEIKRLRTHKTRAVIVLHYGGHPAPIDDILDAAQGIPVIEDAANAPASTHAGRACGTIGAAGVWSFDAMKILSCGDGGALRIAPEYVDRARRLRYLGLDESGTTGMAKAGSGADRWWEYNLTEPAGRHVSNDLCAAIGREQLRKLPAFVVRRRAIWDTYQRELTGMGDLQTPPEPMDGCTSSYYLYWVQTSRRDALAAHLKGRGIYTTYRYHPLHRAWRYHCELTNSESASARTLNIPLHQNLTDDDVGMIVEAIWEFYR
jgi:aminotransferase